MVSRSSALPPTKRSLRSAMGSLRTLLAAAALVCTLPAAWADDPPAAAKPAATAPARQARSSAPGKSTPAPRRALDLSTPDVRKLVPHQQLDTPLSDEDFEPPETVDVKGEKPAPNVPGGFASIWWGVTHPSQVWRIFAPVQ
jgi:hypothetical protein